MSNIVESGNMSYNASMHGSGLSAGFQSFSGSILNSNIYSENSYQETTMSTLESIATLQAKLNQRLGPEYISQRPAPGGMGKLSYIEGWKIIALANEVFGFNGWSSNIVSINVDFIDFSEESKRYNVGVTAIVRVTLRDGVYHEDVGYGLLENSKSKGTAIDKCKKEAVTDAMKRTLRNFGNLMGNCLYDKSFTSEVIKIKVPPPKFDKSTLHRRPEFEEKPVASTSGDSGNMKPRLPPQPAVKQELIQTSGPAPAPQQPPSNQSAPRQVPPAVAQASSSNSAPSSRGDPNPNTSRRNEPQTASTSGTGVGATERVSSRNVNAKTTRSLNGNGSVNMNSNNSNNFVAGSGITNAHNATSNTSNGAINESFSFPSSDDAFFASVDWEGDMGRPIEGDNETDEIMMDFGQGSRILQGPQQTHRVLQGHQQSVRPQQYNHHPNEGMNGAGQLQQHQSGVRQGAQPRNAQQQQPHKNDGMRGLVEMNAVDRPQGQMQNQSRNQQMQTTNQGRNQQSSGPPAARQHPKQNNGNGVNVQRSAALNTGPRVSNSSSGSGPVQNLSGGMNGGASGNGSLKRDSSGLQRPIVPPPAHQNQAFKGQGQVPNPRIPLRDLEVGDRGDVKRSRVS